VKLNQILENDSDASAKDMMEAIDKSFKKYFPNGWSRIRPGTGISSDSISVNIGLIGKDADVPNGIRQNDPMLHTWLLFPDANGYSAEMGQGSIMLNPPEGSYLAMSPLKTKWRKTKGDAKKMVKTFDSFFKKLKDMVKKNQANIFGRNELNDKYFK